jgi:hypothetical protein
VSYEQQQLYEPPADLPAHLQGRPRCAHPDCEAILLPGFDPSGDRCRHHATRDQEHTHAA